MGIDVKSVPGLSNHSHSSYLDTVRRLRTKLSGTLPRLLCIKRILKDGLERNSTNNAYNFRLDEDSSEDVLVKLKLVKQW